MEEARGAPDSGPLAVPEATAVSVEDLHTAVFGAGSLGPLLLTSPGGGRTQGHGRGARSEDSVGRTGAPTLAAGCPPRREARTLRGQDPSARPHCAPSCQRPGLSRAARLRARPAVPGHSVHGRGGLGLWRELGFLSASRTVHQLMNGEPWLQTHHAAEGHKGHVRPGPDAPTWPDPPPPTGH